MDTARSTIPFESLARLKAMAVKVGILNRVSLKLIDVVIRVTSCFPKGHGNLADQLRRAVASNSLNISEGVGEYRPRGSAIQIDHGLQIVSDADYVEGYDTCTLLTKMLINLVKSMEERAAKGQGGPGSGVLGFRILGFRVQGG